MGGPFSARRMKHRKSFKKRCGQCTQSATKPDALLSASTISFTYNLGTLNVDVRSERTIAVVFEQKKLDHDSNFYYMLFFGNIFSQVFCYRRISYSYPWTACHCCQWVSSLITVNKRNYSTAPQTYFSVLLWKCICVCMLCFLYI